MSKRKRRGQGMAVVTVEPQLLKRKATPSRLLSQHPALVDVQVLHDPSYWTLDDIKGRLAETADVLLRLPVPPNGLPAVYRSCMPDIIRDFWEAYGYHRSTARRPIPSAQDIRRMDECLVWLGWITCKRTRNVVWLRACGHSLRKIADALDASHEWVRLLENAGHQAISRRLNLT